MMTCNAFWFRAAWYVSFGVSYFHFFALVVALFLSQTTGPSVWKRFGGYLLALAVVLFLWQFARQPYSCRVVITSPTHAIIAEGEGQRAGEGQGKGEGGGGGGGGGEEAGEGEAGTSYVYTNALAFPALDATLLGYFGMEARMYWTTTLATMPVRHGRSYTVLFGGGYVLGVVSLLWFHALWHIITSIGLGVCVQWCWYHRHWTRHLSALSAPESAFTPNTPTDAMPMSDASSFIVSMD